MATSTPEGFVEQDCTIEYEGKKFTAGGAWRVDDRALVYVKNNRVTDWHGKVLGDVIGRSRSKPRWGKYGMWRMTYVRVLMAGRTWIGAYNADSADCVRLRVVKCGSSE